MYVVGCTIFWIIWLTAVTFETNGGNKRFGDFVIDSDVNSGKTAGFLATGGSTFGAFHSTSLMLANLRFRIRSVGVWKRCCPLTRMPLLSTILNVKVAISQISLETAKKWHLFCCCVVVACRRTFTPIRTIVYLSIQLWPAFLQWTSDDILI